MPHPLLPALASLAALALAACLIEDEKKTRPILPLAVGNAWAYVDSAYYGPDGTGGAGGDSVTVDSTHVAVTGARVVTLGGKAQTVYLWNTRDRATGLPGALTLYLQNRADGNYTVGITRDTAEFLFETLHLKWPTTAGERYFTQFLDFREEGGALIPTIDTVEIEVVNPDTTCSAPAGTFHCVHYRGWRGDAVHADGYYAPGVGFLGSDVVRTREVNGEPREVLFRRRLARYELH